MDLVERDAILETLRGRLNDAASTGHSVLLAGEAGVGKTSVLRALAATHPIVWWGVCDALETPHPLGPLLDIARHQTTRFGARLAGPRPALFEAVLDELRSAPQPILVVIEDAHWADEATLDLIKFLGRRIERTRALLVVSFRDDELSATHPLRRVIGELPAAAVARVVLPPLSPAGVETLARRALRAPTGLFAATQGNPFFVTELLRHRVDAVPHSVQDLVLARFARLDKAAQAIVRLASIVPGQLERWLLDALTTPEVTDLEACLDSGLLLAEGTALRFRHELARVAVEAALPAPVAQMLHARVLGALTASERPIPAARLVHHASLAGDEPAVRRHAAAAADEARARGAHREAARHYGAALQHARDAGHDRERREWLEAFARECLQVDRHDDAIAARLELDATFRRLGDVTREAANLSRLAQLYVFTMRNAQADAASRRAIELLEPLPPGSELAAAYATEASLRMLNRDCAESVDVSRKAIEVARECGDRERVCAASGTLGTALMFIHFEAGSRQLEAAVQMALDEGQPIFACNAMSNLGSASGELMRLDAADHWLRKAIAYAAEIEFDSSRHYSSAWLAACEVLRGDWDIAAERAREVLARSGPSSISRLVALVALGRLATRRGDLAAASDLLDQALALAEPSGTLQRIAPVRSARAEAAHARADLAACAAEAQAALPLALHHGHAWFAGELALWCWRAGQLDAAPSVVAPPYALQISGRCNDAAAAWQQLGCPFEQARALADGDAEAQHAALALFEHLGAAPSADALRRRMRNAGVAGIARGARASTRVRPYGLTTREFEVLQLLCVGLRNAEIATRLNRSVRTVDHHVAAVFAKLGVDSRIAAIQLAQGAGLAPQSGQAPAAN